MWKRFILLLKIMLLLNVRGGQRSMKTKSIMFKNLSIKNFRCLENFQFSFEPNRMILFTGNNGTGKTSVFSALFWALYDETLEGISGDDVINKRKGKDTSVSVSFEYDNDLYEIIAYRKDSKNGNSRLIFKNGIDITPNGSKETLNFISNLIMPKDLFYNCLLFSNFNKFKFTDLSPTDKVEFLENLLELSEYENYRNKIKESIKAKESSISAANESILLYKNNLEKNLISLEAKKTEIEKLKINKDVELKRIESNIQSISEEIKKLEKYLDDNKVLIEKFDKVNSEFNLLDSEISLLNDKKKLEKEFLKNKYNNLLFEYKKEQLSVHMERLKDKEVEINSLESEKKKLSEDYLTKINILSSELKNKLNEESLDLLRNISEVKSKMDSLISENKNLEDRINLLIEKKRTIEVEANAILDGLNEPDPICGVCGQKIPLSNLSKVENKHKNLMDEIYKIDKAIDSINNSVSKIDNDIKDLEKELNVLESKRGKLKEFYDEQFSNESKKIKEEYDSRIIFINNKLDTLIQEKAGLLNNVKQFEENKKKELYEDFIKEYSVIERELDSKIESLNNNKQELSFVLKELSKSIEELESVKNKINNLKENLSSLIMERKMSLERFDELINRLENDVDNIIKENEDIQNKLKELENSINNSNFEIEILNFWDKGFGPQGIRGIVFDEIIPFLNSTIKKYLIDIPIRVTFSTTSATKKGDLRNKFNVEVLHTRNLSSFKEISSGERRMVDILCMFAIRELLEYKKGVKFNLYLLDEVLDTLDEENIDLITGFLKEFSNSKTVVIISHTLRGKNLEVEGFCDVYRFG